MHPTERSGHFIMVVSFARSSFRLDEDNVGLSLEAALGGYCSSLKVSCLRDRVFSFHVSCKDVGFFILHQRSFVCDHFKCFFHLWGHGGPYWEQEFKRWQLECQQEWILVSPSKARATLGLLAMQNPPAKSSLKSTMGAKKKLRFATLIKMRVRVIDIRHLPRNVSIFSVIMYSF